MNLLRRAARLIFQNVWWKLSALAIAFVIWALVATEPELSTFNTVRLEYRNFPADLEMSSPPTETVTLELRGPAGELRGLGDGRSPAVVLDMADMSPGEHTFYIAGSNVRLARGVRLVRSMPAEVRFDFERRLVSRVPVKVRFTGQGEHGNIVGQYSVNPEELVIEGAASHVAKVTAAVTDPVDVSSLTDSGEFHVNAFINDPYVRFQSSPRVTVAVTMKKK